jgi:hypothetical protein
MCASRAMPVGSERPNLAMEPTARTCRCRAAVHRGRLLGQILRWAQLGQHARNASPEVSEALCRVTARGNLSYELVAEIPCTISFLNFLYP